MKRLNTEKRREVDAFLKAAFGAVADEQIPEPILAALRKIK